MTFRQFSQRFFLVKESNHLPAFIDSAIKTSIFFNHTSQRFTLMNKSKQSSACIDATGKRSMFFFDQIRQRFTSNTNQNICKFSSMQPARGQKTQEHGSQGFISVEIPKHLSALLDAACKSYLINRQV